MLFNIVQEMRKIRRFRYCPAVRAADFPTLEAVTIETNAFRTEFICLLFGTLLN